MRTGKIVFAAGCLTLMSLICATLTLGSLLWYTSPPAAWQTLSGFNAATAPVNRLVVQGDDGNIYTMQPDGGDRIALTTGATSDHFFAQPTWSPTADRIAWVEYDARRARPEASLVISGRRGIDQNRVEVPSLPFYLSWSPNGNHLAYLANRSSRLALRLIDVAGGAEEPVTLGEGRPLYFSWAPDNERLITHTSGKELALLSLDGGEVPLPVKPAIFSAPEWSADGSKLVYAVNDGDKQRLVVANLEGKVETSVTTFDLAVSFGLSPAENQLAYIVTSIPIAGTAFGPLYVADLDSSEARQISAEPVLAFFWSPDGRSLIYLRPEPHPFVTPVPEAAPLRQEQLWLRWHVWDGTRTYPLSIFAPTSTFLADYLRFFDQYSRGMTLWAPDSSAFVYAGMGENGLQGIWVQPVAPESMPERVSRGVFAAWSPR